MSASDLVAQLAAAGTPPELLASVAKELFAGEIERGQLAERRKHERERKAKSRDVTGQDGTACDTPGPVPLDKESPHTPKKIISSEENKSHRARKAGFDLPANIPAEPWAGFEEMRRRIGKPMTDYARRLAVKELDKLAEDGWPPGDVLNHCTMNSYQGIFPPKGQSNGNRQSNSRPSEWGSTVAAADAVIAELRASGSRGG